MSRATGPDTWLRARPMGLSARCRSTSGEPVPTPACSTSSLGPKIDRFSVIRRTSDARITRGLIAGIDRMIPPGNTKALRNSQLARKSELDPAVCPLARIGPDARTAAIRAGVSFGTEKRAKGRPSRPKFTVTGCFGYGMRQPPRRPCTSLSQRRAMSCEGPPGVGPKGEGGPAAGTQSACRR